MILNEFHYPTRRPATFDPTSGLKVILELPWSFFGASNAGESSSCHLPAPMGRADTLKLQSKLSNSAVEQTGLRDYMASKVDCKGVGIVGN